MSKVKETNPALSSTFFGAFERAEALELIYPAVVGIIKLICMVLYRYLRAELPEQHLIGKDVTELHSYSIVIEETQGVELNLYEKQDTRRNDNESLSTSQTMIFPNLPSLTLR